MLLPMEYYLNKQWALLTVAASALVIHKVYKKYEVPPSSYLPTFLLLFLTPLLFSSFLLPHFHSLRVAYLTGFSTFYTTLITSIASYRLSPWHPLAKYPGPVLAKLSKFYMLWYSIRGEQLTVVDETHRKYGRHVRLGPNELSFADADLLPSLLAPDMPRGPMWDGRRNLDAAPHLINTRSSADHARMRVPWTYAFSTASVREYHPAIARRVTQLVEELEKRVKNGGAVNLSEWMSFFSSDFMGDMAFGGGFELMRDGDVSGLWKMMMHRNFTLGWQMHIPWANRLLLKVPSRATEAVVKFRNFTIQCAMQRKQKGALVKDLFYHLINEGNEDLSPSRSITPQDLSEVIVNGEVAILAGSDSASVSLSNTFFYLLTHPECHERLKQEIDEVFPIGEDPMADANAGTRMAEMKYLNAIINETMRLSPVVSTALQRAPDKGSGGKLIGKHWLPEGTAVNITSYVIHRDPKYFSPAPEMFWPDRWIVKTGTPSSLEKAASVKTTHEAFIPFSAGHASCAGKNLALAEIRAVVVCLIQKFDMRFQAGYDTSRWEKEKSDSFVMELGELPVVLSLRK